ATKTLHATVEIDVEQRVAEHHDVQSLERVGESCEIDVHSLFPQRKCRRTPARSVPNASWIITTRKARFSARHRAMQRRAPTRAVARLRQVSPTANGGNGQ